MSERLPTRPEVRKGDETLHDRVDRARRAREAAEGRVTRRFAEIKQDERRWRVRENPRSRVGAAPCPMIHGRRTRAQEDFLGAPSEQKGQKNRKEEKKRKA